MKVLVTGGAGFIGTNYVYYHLDQKPDDEIVVLDALTYAGHRANLTDAEARGVRFVQGRIEDREAVYGLFEKEKFDAVVHFAAETHVDRSIESAEVFLTTNVLGTHVLLDAARDYNVKRFHHVSTDEIYGDLGFDSIEKFTEESKVKPSNPYSASKAASDLLALSYFRTFGLAVTVSRCSNNYGPYQDPEKLIPSFITKAAADEKLPLYGSGKNVRDWIYVTDHCEAVMLILDHGKPGEVYNIGGDNDQHNIDITKLILRELGKPETLIAYVEDRKGHDERYSMGYGKLNTAFGWEPKTSFEEGMRKTIDWYTLKKEPQNYERNHSSGRNRLQAGTPDKSYKQAPAADLQ